MVLYHYTIGEFLFKYPCSDPLITAIKRLANQYKTMSNRQSYTSVPFVLKPNLHSVYPGKTENLILQVGVCMYTHTLWTGSSAVLDPVLHGVSWSVSAGNWLSHHEPLALNGDLLECCHLPFLVLYPHFFRYLDFLRLFGLWSV